MSEVLFQITENELETGLRGFPVGYCTTSRVDPQKGLFYVEKPIAELSGWDPEAVIFLLYHGREGKPEEVKAFFKKLQEKSHLKEETLRAIEALPKKCPMKRFSIALLLAGMLESTGDYREDALQLIAKAPQLVAACINSHAGWGATPPFDPQLGYMENFANMLHVPNTDKGRLIEVFRLFNILHFDHGGGNLSTFVGKAVASSLEDLYGSMAAAISALEGPKHGKANQDCLAFVREVEREVGDNPSPETVDDFIRHRLAKNELIFGFGHAVLRVEDPRATVMYDFLAKRYPHHPLVHLGALLRHEGSKVLAENPKVADPHPNVDAISGVMLVVAGFDYPEYFPVLFGLSRLVGIARQIVYERCEARGGKGTPIVRPKYLYKPMT